MCVHVYVPHLSLLIKLLSGLGEGNVKVSHIYMLSTLNHSKPPAIEKVRQKTISNVGFGYGEIQIDNTPGMQQIGGSSWDIVLGITKSVHTFHS